LDQTVLHCDSSVLQGAITISVLPKGIILQVTLMLHTLISTVFWTTSFFYTVTSVRVNHSINQGNITRLLSSVNSEISVYKKH